MTNADLTVYEVEFCEFGNPKGPDYRWFSRIGHALEFMNGITNECHVEQMTFRAHVLEGDAGGVATFLNHLTGERKEPAEGIPF